MTLADIKLYVTRSRSGHYTATARDKKTGALVAITVHKHGHKEQAKAELSETLAKKHT
jgi:hypothetical protein